MFSDMKPEDAWARRILSGQAMNSMATAIGRIDTQRALKDFADWTDRIAAGELPAAKPQRPQGRERNVVITQWDFSDPKHYLHDITSTDKRKPTLNANGLIYGAVENSTDLIPVLDPVNHTRLDLHDAGARSKNAQLQGRPDVAVAVLGRRGDLAGSVHHPQPDVRREGPGLVHLARRGAAQSGLLQEGLGASVGQGVPARYVDAAPCDVRSQDQQGHADPHLLSDAPPGVCRGRQQYAVDQRRRPGHRACSAGSTARCSRRLATRRRRRAGPRSSSTPTATASATNGSSRTSRSIRSKDKRIVGALYGIGVNPQDGTVWGSILTFPGYIVRVDPGSNPSQTALAEIYEPPLPGYGPRGFDIDRNGIAWVPLASGHMGKFDRSKCKVLRGPETATGRHCPEGWTLYPFPGPQMQGLAETGSAEASYYTWVDQFDTFGLGANTPWATGNANESLMALVGEQWLNFVVPYPLGFYAKWMDGRIDDPNGGWKGRGVWATYGTRTPFHLETGKGTRPKVVKFQLRPDPLAR